MKKLVRMLCLLLVLGITVTLFAACGSNDSNTSAASTGQSDKNTQSTQQSQSASTASKLEKVDLKIEVAGDRPPAQDEVQAEISKVSQDELNINLQVDYIPWADYNTKIPLMAAAGEPFDAFLQFYTQSLTAIAKKQCLPLNDLLDKYGSDLKANIPQTEWDDLTVNGSIYGVPSVYPHTEMGAGFLVRKDLREKYGIPEIKDVKTFEQFCDAIAKNEKGVTPITRYPYYGAFLRDWNNGAPPLKKLGGQLLQIDYSKKPYKVYSILNSPDTPKIIAWGRMAVSKGWISNDAPTIKDTDDFLAGKGASMSGDLFNIADRGSKIAQNFGGEVELAIIRPDLPFYNIDVNNNFAQISSTSKNPERAMMFLNWLRKDDKNYDLYMYGIEGKQYTVVDGKIKLPDGVTIANNPYNPTPWIANYFPWNKQRVGDPPTYKTALDFWNNMKPVQEPVKSFIWDTTNIKTELTACQKVWNEELSVVVNGLGNDADYQKASQDMVNAGINKLVDDCQKQLDAFSAANNIK